MSAEHLELDIPPDMSQSDSRRLDVAQGQSRRWYTSLVQVKDSNLWMQSFAIKKLDINE